MRLITYEKLKYFLDENKADIMEHEVISQLLYYMVEHEVKNPSGKSWMAGRIQEDEAVVLLFAMIGPSNLQLYIPRPLTELQLQECTRLMFDYIKENKIKVNGFYANGMACRELCSYYEETGLRYVKHLELDLMQLTKLNDVSRADAYTTLAIRKDEMTLAKWLQKFSKEALGQNIGEKEARLRVEGLIGGKMLYILLNSVGQAVSMAAVTRQLEHGVSLNYVYTPCEYRGKGYAKANIYNISRICMEDANQYCSLYVDKNNPISRQVYQDVGYQVIDDCYEYILES